MRTTSRILGIIGSALAILLGVASMLLALIPVPSFNDGFDFYDGYSTVAAPLPDLTADGSAYWDTVDVAGFSFGCAAILGGLIGAAGCVIVSKRNKAAGALFIVASVISVSTFYPTVLFIIAAVQALKKLRPVMPPGYYAACHPAYPAYPPPYGTPVAYPPPYGTPVAYPPPYEAAPGAYPPSYGAVPAAYPPPYEAAPGEYPPPPFGAYPPFGAPAPSQPGLSRQR